VVAAAMTSARPGVQTVTAAGLMALLLAGLAITGKPLAGRFLERFTPNGIVASDPAAIDHVEIRMGKARLDFRREPAGGWSFDDTAAPPEVVAHLETALRFMHVSAPTRVLDEEEREQASLGDFGLDPPAYVVTLGGAQGGVTTADFGALNPSQTGQYVRLLDRRALYLMPRHVDAEWRLAADLAEHSRPAATQAGTRLLLPVSIAQIWAVELVYAGKLHRFERDGAGHWFLHVGQHSHAAGAPAHVADPAKAPLIAAAFESFGETTIESASAAAAERARFGLDRPMLIALLYPRDSSTAVAKLEMGAAADGGFGRYAAIAPEAGIVTIPADVPQRLVELLQAVGAVP